MIERMQCKRSLQWLKTLIWSSLFQLFFYNSNIKSTIRIVIQHPLIYEPITDEFVIRWGRSSRFFHASGCKLHNIVFHHGSLLPLEIHGNMNWTDDNSLSKNNPKALSLTGFLDIYVDSGSVWLKVPLPKNNQTFYTCWIGRS